MALWGLLSGKEAWYTMTEATLKSVVKPVWDTVSSTDNLKAAGSAAISAVVENPLTAIATVAVGAATYVVYRNKGFGIGLGQFNASFDNFLANASVRIGLGKKKPHEVEALDGRMRAVEEGLFNLRQTENRHHRETTEAITGVSNTLTERFSALFRTIQADKTEDNILRAVREGNSSLIIQMGEVKKGLEVVAAESSGIKAQVIKLSPAPHK
jgi:hypothetical protein